MDYIAFYKARFEAVEDGFLLATPDGKKLVTAEQRKQLIDRYRELILPTGWPFWRQVIISFLTIVSLVVIVVLIDIENATDQRIIWAIMLIGIAPVFVRQIMAYRAFAAFRDSLLRDAPLVGPRRSDYFPSLTRLPWRAIIGVIVICTAIAGSRISGWGGSLADTILVSSAGLVAVLYLVVAVLKLRRQQS